MLTNLARVVVAAALALVALPGFAPADASAAPAKFVETVPGGTKVTFSNARLPAKLPIELPKGTTVVKATATLADSSDGVYVGLNNLKTRHRRCVMPFMLDWDRWPTGSVSCAGVATIDPPGTVWEVTANADASSTATIVVEFMKRPLDGPVSKLNLARLSMPQFELGTTKDIFIESFDGTRLHAQLTLPKTDAKVPTVVVSNPYYYGSGLYEEGLVRDWVPRGYAVLTVDVRGYNRSEGCVEVWGPNEQKDQKAIVDWVAKQPWSDDRVGMWGISYVGTTPIEAAVQRPKALKAIVVGAPVVSAYEDWHFGGVANGENFLSPVSYQALTGAYPDTTHGVDAVAYAANGLCDPTLLARANDPRSVYNSFYEERNFAKLADKIDAAVLYTHGWIDWNVKNVMASPFFNNITAPKLGLFGQWNHAWPSRPDTFLLFLAWMDQYVKGRDLGLEKLPTALVMNNENQVRELDAWPTKTNARRLYLGAEEKFVVQPAASGGEVLLTPEKTREDPTGPKVLLRYAEKITKPLEVVGRPTLELDATLAGGPNGHVAAFLYDSIGGERTLVSLGMANLAHRFGHDRYEPVKPGEKIEMDLQFLMANHVFRPGHELVLELRGAHVLDFNEATMPGPISLLQLTGKTRLVLPTLPLSTARKPAATEDWR